MGDQPTRRDPFISDERHLAAVAGSSYAVLRPPRDVEAAFGDLQDQIRSRVDDLASFPRPHVTICGFPKIAEDAERAVVEAWARETPPLDVTTGGVASFPPPFQVVIAEVVGTAQLRSATARFRRFAAEAAIGFFDNIPVSDWIFHMSAAYCDRFAEDEWRALAGVLPEFTLREATATARRVELVAFDGGSEQLVAEVDLTGTGEASPERWR
jgi:2'-5' RNA ligase